MSIKETKTRYFSNFNEKKTDAINFFIFANFVFFCQVRLSVGKCSLVEKGEVISKEDNISNSFNSFLLKSQIL